MGCPPERRFRPSTGCSVAEVLHFLFYVLLHHSWFSRTPEWPGVYPGGPWALLPEVLLRMRHAKVPKLWRLATPPPMPLSHPVRALGVGPRQPRSTVPGQAEARGVRWAPSSHPFARGQPQCVGCGPGEPGWRFQPALVRAHADPQALCCRDRCSHRGAPQGPRGNAHRQAGLTKGIGGGHCGGETGYRVQLQAVMEPDPTLSFRPDGPPGTTRFTARPRAGCLEAGSV